MVYFLKVTNSGNGVVVTDKPLTRKTVKINGKDVQISQQQSDLKIGFVAIQNAKLLDLKPGQDLPLVMTNKKVTDRTGKELDLFWCDPE